MTSVAQQLFAAQALGGAMVRETLAAEHQHLAARYPVAQRRCSALLEELFRFQCDNHLSQATVAQLCGVAHKTYHCWKSGRHRPRPPQVRRIQQVLLSPLDASVPRKGTLAEALVTLITESPTQPVAYRVLAARLGKAAKHVHQTCQNLVKAGQLNHVARGVYALAEGRT